MRTVFSTNDIRGRIDDTLTTDYAWTTGKAFAEWLPEEGSIIVIHSLSANNTICRALSEGVLLQGRDISGNTLGDLNSLLDQLKDSSVAGGIYVNHDELENLECISLFDNKGTQITSESGLNEIRNMIDSGNFIPAIKKGVDLSKSIS
jgi:hypothetical protein